MAFVKKTWKDRLVEYAGRRKITNTTTNESQIVDVERAEGQVSEEGSAFSAANMNDLEQRVADEFTELNKNMGGCEFEYNAHGAYVKYVVNGAIVKKKLGSADEFEVTTETVIPEDVDCCVVIMYAKSAYSGYHPNAQSVTTTKGTVENILNGYTDNGSGNSENNMYTSRFTVVQVKGCAGATLTIKDGSKTNVSGGYKILLPVAKEIDIKNLFYTDNTATKTDRGITYYFDHDTQEFVLNGTFSTSGDLELVRPLYIDWVPGEKYTVSIRHTGGTATLSSGTNATTYAYGIFASDASKFLRGLTGNASFQEMYSFTGTAFEHASYIFYLQCWRPGTVFDNYRIKVQIEHGEVVSDWAPHIYE